MIHISNNNSKNVGPNFSIVPIKDCPNCKFCLKKCYALKALRQYPGTRKAWGDNSRAVRSGKAWMREMIAYLASKVPLSSVSMSRGFLQQAICASMGGNRAPVPQYQIPRLYQGVQANLGDQFPGYLQVVLSAFPGMSVPTFNPIAFAGKPDDYTYDPELMSGRNRP